MIGQDCRRDDMFSSPTRPSVECLLLTRNRFRVTASSCLCSWDSHFPCISELYTNERETFGPSAGLDLAMARPPMVQGRNAAVPRIWLGC